MAKWKRRVKPSRVEKPSPEVLVSQKLSSARVPARGQIKFGLPRFFFKSIGFDPNRLASKQADAVQREFCKIFGRAAGTTAGIVNGFRGLTVRDLFQIENSAAREIASFFTKMEETGRRMQKLGRTAEAEMARAEYVQLRNRYVSTLHVQVTCKTLIADFAMRQWFPRWNLALRKRVLYEMSPAFEVFEKAHYQHLMKKMVASARRNALNAYRMLRSGKLPKSLVSKIKILDLESAEILAKRLSQLGKRPLPRDRWKELDGLVKKAKRAKGK